MNQYGRTRAACQQLHIFDLISLLCHQGKKNVVVGQGSGLIQLPNFCLLLASLACLPLWLLEFPNNATLPEITLQFLLEQFFCPPYVIPWAPLQFLVLQLLQELAVTNPFHESTPEELSGTTSMLGNWLSSRAALWVILPYALVRSIFLSGSSVGRGAWDRTWPRKQKQNTQAWLKTSPPFPLKQRRSIHGTIHLDIPSCLIFPQCWGFCLFVSGTCKPDGLSADILRCGG